MSENGGNSKLFNHMCNISSNSNKFKLADKVHVKTKGKIKPHRPIILLRRNSVGNTSTCNGLKSSKVAKKQISRLKSMSEIERKFKHSPKHGCLTVQSEDISDFAVQEVLHPASQQQLSDNFSDVKVEHIEHVPEMLHWQNSDCNIPTQYGTFSPQVPQHFISNNVPFISCDAENKENEPMFVKQETNVFPSENRCTFTRNAVLNVHDNMYRTNVDNYSLLNFREQVTFHPQSSQFAYPQQQLACNPQHLSGPSFSNSFLHQPVAGTFPLSVNGETQQQCFRPASEMQMRYTMRQNYDHPVDDSLTNITWLGKMGVNNFLPVPLERERKLTERDDKRGKPPYSYMALIQFAINSSATGRMTLRQIYQWIEEKFPYFKTAKPGWKNSIRHNLSLHDIFVREVSAGSKASYWTLRADLNMRPLTLDNMGGNTQHAFQDYGQTPRPQSMWSLKTFSQSQKPILPRLPPSSRPYVLLPVPLLQSQVRDTSTTSMSAQIHSTPSRQSDFDIGSVDGSGTSPSVFRDSGFCSDLSHSTPSASGLSSESGSHHRSSERSGANLKDSIPDKDISPMLSQANALKSKTGSQKKLRKEPLQTLNDSLNSSLHFKESSESDSPSPSPRRRPLSPSGAQFLLCKKLHKQSTKASQDTQPKATIGFSEESFSEILNDLGSPFRGFLLNEHATTPRLQSARKRRRSWGSPDSSYSDGTNLHRRLRVANETTPILQQIRRVKSDAGDLAKSAEETEELVMPTSTPMSKEKWKKSLQYKSEESHENFRTSSQLPIATSWVSDAVDARQAMRTPSPIPSASKVELDSDFLRDIMGTVFKTPDRPSESECHFDSFTPARVTFSELTAQQANEFMVKPEKAAGASDPDPSCSQQVSSTTPVKVEALDNSFSKLLDLSGSSGTFPRFNTHFSDITDLNLSWSSLTQL